jgi:hypothetical protein
MFEAGNFAAARVGATAGNVLEPAPEREPVDGAWRSRHRRALADALLAAAGAALRGIGRGGDGWRGRG